MWHSLLPSQFHPFSFLLNSTPSLLFMEEPQRVDANLGNQFMGTRMFFMLSLHYVGGRFVDFSLTRGCFSLRPWAKGTKADITQRFLWQVQDLIVIRWLSAYCN